ncbi:MAG: 4Fe-4S binding protein [Dissulfurimicrobium sp.]|uniref:4Fe-4S binding protein n=1 Tax=Dissulfurimicrobium sp. TaxID=2022436 RepID=UPI00404A42AE
MPCGPHRHGRLPQNESRCMQCQHCLAICPTAAISILGKDPDMSTPLKGNMPDPSSLAILIKRKRGGASLP